MTPPLSAVQPPRSVREKPAHTNDASTRPLNSYRSFGSFPGFVKFDAKDTRFEAGALDVYRGGGREQTRQNLYTRSQSAVFSRGPIARATRPMQPAGVTTQKFGLIMLNAMVGEKDVRYRIMEEEARAASLAPVENRYAAEKIMDKYSVPVPKLDMPLCRAVSVQDFAESFR